MEKVSHCIKYHKFAYFPGAEIQLKCTVSNWFRANLLFTPNDTFPSFLARRVISLMLIEKFNNDYLQFFLKLVTDLGEVTAFNISKEHFFYMLL